VLHTHPDTSNKQAKKPTAFLPSHGKNSCNLRLKGSASKIYLSMMPLGPKHRLGPMGILPAPLPSQMGKREPCRETAAAVGPLEGEPHQKWSPSRQQDGLLQPVSGCRSPHRSRACSATTSRTPQNPEVGLSGQGNVAPLPAALPAHLCSSCAGASLFDCIFCHAFLISLRAVIHSGNPGVMGLPANPASPQQGTEPVHSSVWARSPLAQAERWLVFRERCARPGSRQDAACSAQWETKTV